VGGLDDERDAPVPEREAAGDRRRFVGVAASAARDEERGGESDGPSEP
jgi:hypothetical protein